MSYQLDGQELALQNLNLAYAKANLSKLVERAAAGETVRITRRGKPVVQITAVQTPRKRIDLSALRALTDMMPVQRESARDLVRRLRDQDRY
jgi:prevent-host-death family protein